ncbi:hypothetical protein G443_004079 [Actinoalloteichus cyanogriseus DSM 43889]|uniref:Uncharacterized protein n=1 Tax=Actinoalloteichus caeruleus DSM 43889 TaxID=1120930 RepID=A0ABT1JNR8_ACTCY|nr:hypothetical protein [Actinoalloteichus caeruleus DSM 43889]
MGDGTRVPGVGFAGVASPPGPVRTPRPAPHRGSGLVRCSGAAGWARGSACSGSVLRALGGLAPRAAPSVFHRARPSAPTGGRGGGRRAVGPAGCSRPGSVRPPRTRRSPQVRWRSRAFHRPGRRAGPVGRGGGADRVRSPGRLGPGWHGSTAVSVALGADRWRAGGSVAEDGMSPSPDRRGPVLAGGRRPSTATPGSSVRGAAGLRTGSRPDPASPPGSPCGRRFRHRVGVRSPTRCGRRWPVPCPDGASAPAAGQRLLRPRPSPSRPAIRACGRRRRAAGGPRVLAGCPAGRPATSRTGSRDRAPPAPRRRRSRRSAHGSGRCSCP